MNELHSVNKLIAIVTNRERVRSQIEQIALEILFLVIIYNENGCLSGK